MEILIAFAVAMVMLVGWVSESVWVSVALTFGFACLFGAIWLRDVHSGGSRETWLGLFLNLCGIMVAIWAPFGVRCYQR
jgi:hypothetical protein